MSDDIYEHLVYDNFKFKTIAQLNTNKIFIILVEIIGFSSNKVKASIWKAVLYFDKSNTSKILCLDPKNSLIPETKISLVIIKILGMPIR